MGVLRGANAPLLQKLVVEELAKEKRVLEDGTERRVVRVIHSDTLTPTFTHYLHL